MNANDSSSLPGHQDQRARFEQFTASVAEFLLYSSRNGFRLTQAAIAARATRHFLSHDALVGAVFSDLEQLHIDWRTCSASALSKRVYDSKAFQDFLNPLDEDDVDYLDDDELSEWRESHTRWLQHAVTLPAWIPPREEAHAWFEAARSKLPRIETSIELARWLDVSIEEFDTVFVSPRYRLRTHTKANGTLRLLEIPPESLRVLQRRLLHRMLDQVSPHSAAHAYRHGRSVHTHAAAHTGRAVVIRLDLEHFFPSISGARVFLLFRALGFRADIANVLTSLCVTSQSRTSLQRALGPTHIDFYERYSVNHLPQGAPTSAALANLCAYSLDTRLSALAEAFNATYTRYADDLVFSGSGDIAEAPRRFVRHAREIIHEEGFRLNVDKTRIMHDSTRQSFAGLVVNHKVNLDRRTYDQLKAAVHRASQVPPSSEVHESLIGRIAWLAQSSPERAKKLSDKLYAAWAKPASVHLTACQVVS